MNGADVNSARPTELYLREAARAALDVCGERLAALDGTATHGGAFRSRARRRPPFVERSERNAARMSLVNSCRCSQAAK